MYKIFWNFQETWVSDIRYATLFELNLKKNEIKSLPHSHPSYGNAKKDYDGLKQILHELTGMQKRRKTVFYFFIVSSWWHFLQILLLRVSQELRPNCKD